MKLQLKYKTGDLVLFKTYKIRTRTRDRDNGFHAFIKKHYKSFERPLPGMVGNIGLVVEAEAYNKAYSRAIRYKPIKPHAGDNVYIWFSQTAEKSYIVFEDELESIST